MNAFIAYFDYLGFKQFIENNDFITQQRVMGDNFREMELALSHEKTIISPRGNAIADLSEHNINCINFSDTVVFWTNDDSDASLMEIIKVAHTFTWRQIDYFFPIRGSLVYGEIAYNNYSQTSKNGGVYNTNTLFGTGLINAYLKAES